MRTLKGLILAALFPLLAFPGDLLRISIIQWTSDVRAYNESFRGVLDGIKEFYGFKGGLRINAENCMGSEKRCKELVQRLLHKTDIFVTLGTVPTKVAMSFEKKKPILFTIVGAPKASGIVQNLNHPGKNVTGTSMKIPLIFEIKTIKEIVKPRVLAIPYFYLYPQARATAYEAKVAAIKLGIRPKEIVFGRRSESLVNLKDFLRVELQGSDAVYIPTCPVMYRPENLSTVINVAMELGIPVFGIAKSAVLRGALMSITCDFYRIGYNLGPYVRMVVEGERPGSIPVQVPSSWRIYVNLHTAKRLGIDIPESYLLAAEEIVR